MPLDVLPVVTTTPVSLTAYGGWEAHPERSLLVRTAVRPVSTEVMDLYRLEPENRPPLPGQLLLARADAVLLLPQVGARVRLDAVELGALSGQVFLIQEIKMDDYWAVWNLEVQLSMRLEFAQPAPNYATLVAVA